MVLFVNPLHREMGTLDHLTPPADNISGYRFQDVRTRGHMIGVGAYGPMVYGGAFLGAGGAGQPPPRMGEGGAGIYRGGSLKKKRRKKKVASSSLKKS